MFTVYDETDTNADVRYAARLVLLLERGPAPEKAEAIRKGLAELADSLPHVHAFLKEVQYL